MKLKQRLRQMTEEELLSTVLTVFFVLSYFLTLFLFKGLHWVGVCSLIGLGITVTWDKRLDRWWKSRRK